MARILNEEKDNLILNGDYSVDQRNASLVGTPYDVDAGLTNKYLFDRWRLRFDETAVTSSSHRALFTLGQEEVPGQPKYYASITMGASSLGTYRMFTQAIEDVRTLAGKNAGVNFWVRSSINTTIQYGFQQNFGSTGSPSSPALTALTSVVLVANTWTNVQGIIAIPGIGGKTLGTDENSDYLDFRIYFAQNTAMTIDFAQAAVWKDYPKQWEGHDDTIGKLQRYLEKSYGIDTKLAATGSGSGGLIMFNIASGTSSVYVPLAYAIKRIAPQLTAYNWSTGATGSARNTGNSATYTCTLDAIGVVAARAALSSVSSGDAGLLHWAADADYYT